MKKFYLVFFIFLLFSAFNNVMAHYPVLKPIEPKKSMVGLKNRITDLVPVRPGIPGVSPFWNEKAVQFLYPPAFDVKPVSSAFEYRFTIVSQQMDTICFKSKNPNESLSRVWTKISVGKHALTIDALAENGQVLETIYRRSFHRAAEFEKGKTERMVSLEESVKMGLNALVHSPDMTCWFRKEGEPDSTFILYRYPSKIVGSAASALAIYATQDPVPVDAAKALEASRNAADYLLRLSFAKGETWEYHPRTYHPTMFQEILARQKMDPDHYMTSMGSVVAQYYLDVYEATKDKKYIEAAVKIGNTYLNNQDKNGTWGLLVNGKSGALITENPLVPTIVIAFLQRISYITADKRFEEAANKALAWLYENPVRTWNWQGQFEDVRPLPPYQNLTQHEACDFAIYLLQYYSHDKERVKLAKDLIRFSEDQFVVWSNPPVDNPMVQNPDGKRANSAKWITPCVLEQYRCYAPVSASSSKMIKAYIALYRVTKDVLCLDKANALATSMVNLQQTPLAGGRYLTWIQQNSGLKWLNCELYTIESLNELKRINSLHKVFLNSNK